MLYIFSIFVYIFTYVRCVGVFISLQFISSFFLCTAFLSYFLIKPNKDRTKDFHVNVSLKVAVNLEESSSQSRFLKYCRKVSLLHAPFIPIFRYAVGCSGKCISMDFVSVFVTNRYTSCLQPVYNIKTAVYFGS